MSLLGTPIHQGIFQAGQSAYESPSILLHGRLGQEDSWTPAWFL